MVGKAWQKIGEIQTQTTMNDTTETLNVDDFLQSEASDSQSSDDDRPLSEYQKELNGQLGIFEYVHTDDDAAEFEVVASNDVDIFDEPAPQSQSTGLFDAPSTTNTLGSYGASTDTFSQAVTKQSEQSAINQQLAANVFETNPFDTPTTAATTGFKGIEIIFVFNFLSLYFVI